MSKLTTPRAIDALRSRHSSRSGEWATVVEFMHIDFLAVACWQSAQYAVHGYEVKVSRADWLRELKKPSKADPGMSRCDYWYLASPPNVLRGDELPDRWGHVEITDLGTHLKTRPERLREGLEGSVELGPHGGIIRPDPWRSRESFAMLARRFSYEAADKEQALRLLSRSKATLALDTAASLTGRLTSADRKAVKEFKEGQRQHRVDMKSHEAHVAAGVEYDHDCPYGWCAQFAKMMTEQ